MTSPADPISPALEHLLARFGEMVRAAARSRRLDEADVDEVLQEVRIRLWRTLGSAERIAGVPASYVYRAATSAAVDLIRRRRARREESLDDRFDPAPMAAMPEVERHLEAEETTGHLEQAVTGLIASRRAVVRMHLAGYHLTEIARVLDWSEAKTRNLVYRGLTDLRQRLSELGVGAEVEG